MKYLKAYKLFESSLLELSDNVDNYLMGVIKKNFKKGSKILEISCGNGADAKYLQDSGYDVICTEIDENYVRNANNLGLKCIKHDTRDNFPFSDKQFDLIYAKLSLHYFTPSELNKIFKEFKRISHNILFTVKVQEDDFKTGKVIMPPNHWIGIVNNNYGHEESFEIKSGELYGKPAKWVEIFAKAKPFGVFKNITLDLNDIFMDLMDQDLIKDKKIYYLDEWTRYELKGEEIFVNNREVNEWNIEAIEFEIKFGKENLDEIKYTLERAKNYFDTLNNNNLKFHILKFGEKFNFGKVIKLDEIDNDLEGVDSLMLNIYKEDENEE
jgi:uncharacterized UPF0146 family protein